MEQVQFLDFYFGIHSDMFIRAIDVSVKDDKKGHGGYETVMYCLKTLSEEAELVAAKERFLREYRREFYSVEFSAESGKTILVRGTVK